MGASPDPALDAKNPALTPTEQLGERKEQAAQGTRWLVAALSIASLIALVPLWEPLLLAIYFAIVVYPLFQKLSRRLHGRTRAAALFTLLLLVLVLAPAVLASLSVYRGAVELVSRLRDASDSSEALRQLVSTGPGAKPIDLSPAGALKYAREHGMGALNAAQTVFGAATSVVLGMFVFTLGFHTLLVDGRRAYNWLLQRSPIPHTHAERLSSAFSETARGLLVGVGLTALLQGVAASIGYFALGVPQAAVLGLLTTIAALIPSIGTGLVWVPVTAGLYLSGRPQAALVLLCIGVFVSVLDNLVRPWLSRYGDLNMSSFLTLIAMLGGAAAFGGFGVLLGPLLLRLAIEGVRVLHDARLDAPRPPSSAEVNSAKAEEQRASQPLRKASESMA